MLSEWGKILATAQSYERAHVFGNVGHEVATVRGAFARIGDRITALSRLEHREEVVHARAPASTTRASSRIGENTVVPIAPPPKGVLRLVCFRKSDFANSTRCSPALPSRVLVSRVAGVGRTAAGARSAGRAAGPGAARRPRP